MSPCAARTERPGPTEDQRALWKDSEPNNNDNNTTNYYYY